MSAGYTLNLVKGVKRGGSFSRVITRSLKGWRRSIRAKGGFWIGTGTYEDEDEDAVHEFFLNRLEDELIETAGGAVTWQGIVAEMALQIGSDTWRRSVYDLANHVRSIYSSIGDNLLTNGGGESGVWAGYNSPTLVEQSTAWRTQGIYSIHIVAGAASKGAWIQQGIAITARTPYDMRVSVSLISGTWMVAVVRTDTGESLAKIQSNEVGETVLQCSIQDSNEYSGTVDIRIETIGGTGEIYCDAAVFQRGPIRAETSIVEEVVSQAEFGRIEAVLLRAGMTTEAAANEVQTYLAEHAWPRSLPPDEFEATALAALRGAGARKPKLEMTFAGYWATLNFRHSPVMGTDESSAHIATLVGQAEFVSAGSVQTNDAPFQIDDRAPVKVGDTLREVAEAGDGSGNRWDIGVYDGRRLEYRLMPRELSYRYRAGRLYDIHNRLVQPWLVRPGWILLEDMPVGPGFASATAGDDPRWVYAEEVEFEAPDKVHFRRSIE